MKRGINIAFIIIAMLFFSCQIPKGGEIMKLNIESTAFKNGDFIPDKYTCNGLDISPPLTWDRGPEGTKSYVLISDDPDAPVGTWVHWVMFNIPPEVTSLKENFPKRQGRFENGIMQGRNDFGYIGYGGPCPPSGVHRYFFRIYALDIILPLQPGATKKEVERAMEGHVIAAGELMGRYSR